MKPISITIRVLLGTLLLIASSAPGGATLPASAAPPSQASGGGDLLAFQLVAPGSGWALMGQQLFWTDDNGQSWRDVTPPGLGTADMRTASFADAAHGWVATTTPSATGELSYGLARTADGGRTWDSHALALFAAGDEAGMAGEVFLQLLDARTGWLLVKQATSINFDLGTLFKTEDGGASWTRLSLPVGEPVQFKNALDGEQDASATGRGRYVTHDGGHTWVKSASPSGNAPAGASGLSDVSMATAREGWAKSAAGQCEAGTCMFVTRLMGTGDGGQTWTPVGLPGGHTALEQSFAAPSSAPAAPQSAGDLLVTYSGQGFDFCDPQNGLPALDAMQTWYNNSPYKVWNLYLGGVSNHGLCGTLTKDFIRQLAQQGWLFIPTWVGPQAPCTGYAHQMSTDPNTARSQGITEADLARDVAANLGLTLSDLSGTVIYYDVEYFNHSPDLSCLAAVQAFVSGWSGELRANGIQAGVYGAPCGQSLSAFVNIPNVPDMVWIARWLNPAYNPNASVWGSPICGLDNTLWTNHQRMLQYAGGHNETWGNVTFNIDSDVIDANVAKVLVNCVPNFGQVGLFASADFGGACAVKSLGEYPTAASLALPFSSIGSLAVGAYVTATLCQGAFFTGTCQDFTGDVSDLSGQPVGTNPISSVRIATSLVLTNHVYIPTALMN